MNKAKGRPAIDMAGQRVGMWLVLRRVASGTRRDAMWETRCDCGAIGRVGTGNLRRGRSNGCKKCTTIGAPATHGHSTGGKASSTYYSWRAMLSRCENPAVPAFPSYGGRGIAVCSEWHSFERFLADLGERPAGTTLDREDGTLGYQPGNCRWVDARTQGRNRRTVKLNADLVNEIHGRCEHGESQASVARRIGVTPQTICDIRHGRTWPEFFNNGAI